MVTLESGMAMKNVRYVCFRESSGQYYCNRLSKIGHILFEKTTNINHVHIMSIDDYAYDEFYAQYMKYLRYSSPNFAADVLFMMGTVLVEIVRVKGDDKLTNNILARGDFIIPGLGKI